MEEVMLLLNAMTVTILFMTQISLVTLSSVILMEPGTIPSLAAQRINAWSLFLIKTVSLRNKHLQDVEKQFSSAGMMVNF